MSFTIGVGAGKFLKVRRIFFPNFPKFARKKTPKKETFLPKFPQICPKKKTPKKETFLPKFPLNLRKFPLTFPKSIKWKRDLKRNRLHFDFGCHFLLNQSTYSDFAKVFTHFAQISTAFGRILRESGRIFTNSKVLGVLLHPRLLHKCFSPTC